MKRGHKVSAAFLADLKGEYPMPLPDGINPLPLPGWWSPSFGQVTLSKIGGYLSGKSSLNAYWNRVHEALSWRTFRWHGRRVQRRIEREFANRWQEFDVVYVHGDPFLARLVSSFCPTVLMLPGPVSSDFAPVLRAVHAVCAHDDALTLVREFLGDHLIELPLGISSQFFTPGPTPVRSTLGWTSNDLVMGYVGRLSHIKGVDLLSAAFYQNLQNFPNIKLLIVGSGVMDEHLRIALASAFEQGKVHIEPAMPQECLAPWYRAMDLMVMPSRYETMSSAVLEAMACGVPFLASDVGGNSTLGMTGAGWLFQKGSSLSLSESLSSIIQNPSEMRARGAIAPSYIRERHSWAASAERLEIVIKTLLREK